jgi:hypothetical protein
MLQDLQNKLKFRALIVFGMIHIGLLASIAAIARLSADVGGSPALWIVLAGALLTYFGIVLMFFFILWPLWPLITMAREAQKASSWIELLIRELPSLIENLPRLAEALQKALATVRDSFKSRS